MGFQVGDRVWICLPFPGGQLKQGTIYAICPGRRWPYHVRPDGADEGEGGVAYTAEELASADLSLDQVVLTHLPQADYELFTLVMG